MVARPKDQGGLGNNGYYDDECVLVGQMDLENCSRF
jgi:hypothetical protein